MSCLLHPIWDDPTLANMFGMARNYHGFELGRNVLMEWRSFEIPFWQDWLKEFGHDSFRLGSGDVFWADLELGKLGAVGQWLIWLQPKTWLIGACLPDASRSLSTFEGNHRHTSSEALRSRHARYPGWIREQMQARNLQTKKWAFHMVCDSDFIGFYSEFMRMLYWFNGIL